MKRVKQDLFASILFLIITVFYTIFTLRIRSAPIGNPNAPKIFPYILVILALVFSLYLFGKSIFRMRARTTQADTQVSLHNKKLLMLAGISSLIGIGYTMLFEFLGYPLSTTLFLLAYMFFINGKNHWRINIVVPIAFSICSHFVFAQLLSVPLPLLPQWQELCMGVLENLLTGFSVALLPANIMYVTLGGVLGTIIGMMPGLGPATGVALLLPLSYFMGPTAALITMTGVYYGAMYGGSRASILLNTPGDGAAVAATFDGYPLTQKGRAEAALAMSAIASFIGGLIATILFTIFALPMIKLAIKFDPAEYFMLTVFALVATASLTKGNVLKGFLSIIIGLMIATIGIDAQSGMQRFTFGILELSTGIDFLIVIIGIFALGEVYQASMRVIQKTHKVQKKFGKIWVTKRDWKESWKPILRSTPLGFFIGALPGAGGTMASLMAYNNEKQFSKRPEEFGKGAMAGLAAPEAANNAASVGALIPMLTLGIPGSATTAIMLGVLVLLGLQPGPLLFEKEPHLVWGLIASMYIGNSILAVVNIPLAKILVRVLAVPGKILYPMVLGLAFVGVFAISSSVFDFYILILFGFLGIVFVILNIPTAPMILGAIIGNMMEQSFRQALVLSDGSMKIFVASPITKLLLVAILLFLCMPLLQGLKKSK